ncbi:MAG: hypothetical protein JWM44_4192 [Bacilli bacterium]|nr:hypothetical protein [Bacilli bacterium]
MANEMEYIKAELKKRERNVSHVPKATLFRWLDSLVITIESQKESWEDAEMRVSDAIAERNDLQKGNERWKSLRPEVQWFSEQMEATLKRHDHKGGWGPDHCSMNYLLEALKEEVTELSIATGYIGDDARDIIIRKCTNVANYAMMNADRMKQINDAVLYVIQNRANNKYLKHNGAEQSSDDPYDEVENMKDAELFSSFDHACYAAFWFADHNEAWRIIDTATNLTFIHDKGGRFKREVESPECNRHL